MLMSDVTPGSEFDYVPQANTLPPTRTPRGAPGHTADHLTGAERLRLGYLTGQDEDATAAPDNGLSWQGLTEADVPQPEMYRDRWS